MDRRVGQHRHPAGPWISSTASTGVTASLARYARPPVPIQSALKAASMSSTTPASTMARAMCGRPMAPPPASALTRSSSTGAPSWRSRSTILRARPTRPSAIQARLAANAGSSGPKP